MGNNVPSAKIEIKKKDDENAKKEALAKQIRTEKIEQAQQTALKKRAVQRLYSLSKQADHQQQILLQVLEDMQALGADTKRIDQVLSVLKKVEIVLSQEGAKL